MIIDDEMHAIMVKPLPAGCRLTAIYDCKLSKLLTLGMQYHDAEILFSYAYKSLPLWYSTRPTLRCKIILTCLGVREVSTKLIQSLNPCAITVRYLG